MMIGLPYPWDEYARRQAKLARTIRVGDQSWGLEAGLNRIVSAPSGCPPTRDEIDRAVASASRRERYQAGLRLANLAQNAVTAHPEGALLALTELRTARTRLPQDGWALLSEVAAGRNYEQLAAELGARAGALRARVLRLRRALIARRPVRSRARMRDRRGAARRR